ncbi:hypothetical protein KIN20_032528 [Parelaphostrongylus tenuis]|uniref:Uncharacterized protein n=1 Tax=Parelaphostrongylus tenuis TaxID=148309 RepID=A0AAD5WHK1_PARTN|nr:hypothetical protein KIN20_032528 [Parelaphostrongylus tenuis]
MGMRAKHHTASSSTSTVTGTCNHRDVNCMMLNMPMDVAPIPITSRQSQEHSRPRTSSWRIGRRRCGKVW